MSNELSEVIQAPQKKKSLIKRWWFWTILSLITLSAITLIALDSNSAYYELSKLQLMSKQEIIDKFGEPDEIARDDTEGYIIAYDQGFMIAGTAKGATEITIAQDMIKKRTADTYKIFDVTLGSSFDENVTRLGKPNLLQEKDGKKHVMYLTKEDYLLIFITSYQSDQISNIRYVSYSNSLESLGLDLTKFLALTTTEEDIQQFYTVLDKSSSQGETMYMLDGFNMIVDQKSGVIKQLFLASNSIFNIHGVRINDHLNHATEVFGDAVSSQKGIQNTTRFSYHYDDGTKKSAINLSVDSKTQKIGYIEIQLLPEPLTQDEIQQSSGTVSQDLVDSITKDTWPTLHRKQQKELNEYFSEFSAVNFGIDPYIKDSAISNYSADELIKFAINRNQKFGQGNSYDIDLNDENYLSMHEDLVAEVIDYYFGIKIKHKSVRGYDYKNNRYMWSAYRWAYVETNIFSQVQSLTDNGDDTLTAEISIYQDTTSFDFYNYDDPNNEQAKSKRYIPQESWTDDSMFEYIGSAVARIKKNETNDWQLINYEVTHMY